MDIKVDSSTLILAAFSKALAETSPDEIARVLSETLLTKYDTRSYSGNTATVLDVIVQGAVDRLARQVVESVVESYSSQIEEQIRAQVAGRRVSVNLSPDYDSKGISVSMTLGGVEDGGQT